MNKLSQNIKAKVTILSFDLQDVENAIGNSVQEPLALFIDNLDFFNFLIKFQAIKEVFFVMTSKIF